MRFLSKMFLKLLRSFRTLPIQRFNTNKLTNFKNVPQIVEIIQKPIDSQIQHKQTGQSQNDPQIIIIFEKPADYKIVNCKMTNTM
jgi:hypothetical protein